MVKRALVPRHDRVSIRPVDDRARAFERQAHTGDLDARGRALWERARRGELALERVTLAAYLGEPAARRALGGDAPALPADVHACARGLERWGHEALVRAALAAAGRVLHLFAAEVVLHPWSREIVELLGGWLTGDEAARPALERALEARSITGLRLSERDPRQEGLRALDAATRMVLSRARARPVRDAVTSAARALDLEARVDDPEGEVALALREALVPWALGLADPAARFAAPAHDALWAAPPAPPALPRLLERTWQGDFLLDRIDGQRWLVLEQGGRRYRVAPFVPRAGERARAFACSLNARVVAWARRAPDGDRVEVRRFVDGVFEERSLWSRDEVVDVAVSPRSERVAWVVTTVHGSDGAGGQDGPDVVWHLDLRSPAAEPARLDLEHATVRSLHFAADAALGFVTDRAAWEACPPDERKGALLERLGVRLAAVP